MKILAIAFDLDDTLLDTTQLLIPIFGTPLFQERIARPLPLMAGARENLDYLKTKYKLFLVTQGDLQIQQFKIRSLGITHDFEKIYYAEVKKGETKRICFQNLLKDYGLQANELLSIGNRRSSEIREAKRLGAWTCLFSFGEHQLEKAESALDQPDFEVSNHHELREKCKI